MSEFSYACGSREHYTRRHLLKVAGLTGMSFLTPLATRLARAEEKEKSSRAKSLIVLWLEGAPSQLETFDPHPGTEIAAGSKATKTKAAGVLLGDGFAQTAEQMDSISLVRAITSKEGDHARAIYNLKTGYRPDPTLIHPAIGSVICHQMQTEVDKKVDIPRHISILANDFPARGGYLGDQFDAFKVFDPASPVPDVTARVDKSRQSQRLKDLAMIDRRFLDRVTRNETVRGSLGNHNLDAALRMMSSDQLSAFDVSEVPMAERLAFGDTPFGRGCLAAIRLIEKGVRCVEITLGGWDTHVNNHELQAGRISVLDPAFANLIKELKKRDLLDSTMVICGGEFGRTPFVNPLGGRDHWPHGFAIAMAGGGIQGGRVVGETNSKPKKDDKTPLAQLKDANPVENIHATVYDALGIDYQHEFDTPIGRPMKMTEGKPIAKLF